MSNVVSLPPKTLRDAGIRRAVHELPPNAALPGALLFQFFGQGLLQSVTQPNPAENAGDPATAPAASGTGQRR